MTALTSNGRAVRKVEVVLVESYLENWCEDAMDRQIDIFVPKIDMLFEPISVDGSPELVPLIHNHILRSGRKLPKGGNLILRVLTETREVIDASKIADAVCAHYRQNARLTSSSMKQSLVYGVIFLIVGLGFVLALSAMGSFIASLVRGTFMRGIVESLTIFGWVALWRPAEMLLYDWIPSYRQLQLLRRLSKSQVKVLLE